MLLLGAVVVGGLLRVAAEDQAYDTCAGAASLQVGMRTLPSDQDLFLISSPVGSGTRNDLGTTWVIGVEEDECAARKKGLVSIDHPTALFVGRVPIASFVSSVAGSPFLGHAPVGASTAPRHVRFQVFRI